MHRKLNHGRRSTEELQLPFGGKPEPDSRWVLLSELNPCSSVPGSGLTQEEQHQGKTIVQQVNASFKAAQDLKRCRLRVPDTQPRLPRSGCPED